MATRIEIPYDRSFTDAQVNEIIARATVTLNVLSQLGTTYQTIPGYALADYQNATDALEAKVDALQSIAAQLQPLLRDIDALAPGLNALNIGALRTLQGLLSGKPQLSLLDQITGPTTQSGPTTPTPTPAPNP